MLYRKAQSRESQEALFQLVLPATDWETTLRACYDQCVTFKAKQQRVPMESIVATHPLELVHIDYLCL